MEERTEVTKEVREILRNADHPMNTQEIFNECATAEDMREVAHSIHLLTKDGSIERRPVVNKEPAHRYQMPGRWPIEEPNGSKSDDRFNGGQHASQGEKDRAAKKAKKKTAKSDNTGRPTRDQIRDAIDRQRGEFRALDLAIALGAKEHTQYIAVTLSDLNRQGVVTRVKHGLYRKAAPANPAKPKGNEPPVRPVPDVPPPKPDETPPEPDPEPDLPPAAADDEDRPPAGPIHLGAERISVARCALMSDGALFLELDDGRHFELDRESTELIDDHLAVWTAGVAFQSLEDIANA